MYDCSRCKFICNLVQSYITRQGDGVTFHIRSFSCFCNKRVRGRTPSEVLHKNCIIGKSCTQWYMFENAFYISRKVFCEKVITLSLLVIKRFIYNKLQSDDLKNRSSLYFRLICRISVKLQALYI